MVEVQMQPRAPLLGSIEEGFVPAESPEQTAGTLGFLGFTWFTPLVTLAGLRTSEGSKLEQSDLYPLSEENRPQVQLARLEREWRIEASRPSPSLSRALVRAFWKEVAYTSIIKLIYDIVHFVNPFLLSQMILSVKAREHTGYWYAAGMIAIAFSEALLNSHYYRRGYRTGMRVRAALILLMYTKSLRTLPWTSQPQQQRQQPSESPRERGASRKRRDAQGNSGGSGQITNFVSADTDKFTNLMPQICLCWSAPFQIVLCFTMLSVYVGAAFLAGVAVMISMMTMSTILQQRSRVYQAEAMKAKDARLKMQTQIMKIIKIIKLYAWELPVEERAKELRRHELGLQMKYKLWNMGFFICFQLSSTLVSLATFTCYTVVMGRTLDAATAFTALALFSNLTQPLSHLPMMARALTESQVSATRMTQFLLSPEVPLPPSPPVDETLAISLQARQLKWPDGSELLQDVDLKIKKGELVAIVGKTGAGKSGLLYAMLGELPIDAQDGCVQRGSSLGYCAQNAWLRNAMMSDNIVGGESCKQCAGDTLYQDVLHACALAQDLDSLPQRDATMIGDRGINLSGGQKQRVALCRAVYASPDILLLDDVLSALDAHVAAHICANLFQGPILKGKTRVVVTHSRKVLPFADRIIALSDRRVVFDGPYSEFIASGLADEVEAGSDDSPCGAAQAADAAKTNGDCSNGISHAAGSARSVNGGSVTNGSPAASRASAGTGEQREAGSVSMRVYGAYMQAAGGLPAVGACLLTMVGMEGSKNLSDGWLSSWSDGEGSAGGAAIYALIALCVVVAAMGFVLCRTILGQVASRAMHEKCQHTLLRARMSFYDQTPLGQILNRLAEDTNVMDYNIPMSLSINAMNAWRAVAIVVICMMVSWPIIFLMMPILYLYTRVTRQYLPATRDLRRLDATGRSPIIHHFAETLSGVTTIRATNAHAASLALTVQKLERQCEAFYLANIAPRWLSLRLQLLATSLVGTTSMLAVSLSLSGRLQAGVAGLAITYALRLTDSLSTLNQTSANRETDMISVERMHRYITTVEPEAALVVHGADVSPTWPQHGDVEIKDLTVRYREGLPTVLDGVSLRIRGGQRVGIVGRTGCGKSTLLTSLMRLVELEAGTVVIDEVDVGAIGLHSLRSKVAIIPQDPAILTGAVRFNLDPLHMHSDEQLWEVLEKAKLRPRVEAAGGLCSEVEEGGGNYSVGELQLLCLARALLRRLPSGGLLLLDEATSSLDTMTDQLIQQVIRDEFQCTTITIAHRIETLLDYDRIVVLDAGKVVEFDSPGALLSRPSHFQSLARQGGAMALPSIATSSSAWANIQRPA